MKERTAEEMELIEALSHIHTQLEDALGKARRLSDQSRKFMTISLIQEAQEEVESALNQLPHPERVSMKRE